MACDERARALKQLTRYSGGIDDACNDALGCHRADSDQETRDAAVSLCLRRAQRLALDLIAAIDRVPR